MVLNNINVFKELIELGKEITLLRLAKDGEEISKENLYKAREKEADLIKYLDNQDIEILKDVMTVMYIGIDMDYDVDDTPEMIFALEKMFFKSQGWPEKDILVYTISNKSLLDEFLIDGLKVLQIEI